MGTEQVKALRSRFVYGGKGTDGCGGMHSQVTSVTSTGFTNYKTVSCREGQKNLRNGKSKRGRQKTDGACVQNATLHERPPFFARSIYKSYGRKQKSDMLGIGEGREMPPMTAP
jgi:hypothetical protein